MTTPNLTADNALGTFTLGKITYTLRRVTQNTRGPMGPESMTHLWLDSDQPEKFRRPSHWYARRVNGFKPEDDYTDGTYAFFSVMGTEKRYRGKPLLIQVQGDTFTVLNQPDR